MSYQELEEHIKTLDYLLDEHKSSAKSEREDSLAHCLQVEGRMAERLEIMRRGVLRLER